MEGKFVIMSVLLVTLVVSEQIQVEAKSCCPNVTAQNCYNVCRLPGTSRRTCASICGCQIADTCRGGWTGGDVSEHNGDNVVNEYCKLGCVSSVCGAITTLRSSDASEVVNGAVEKCTNACSAVCAKGSITALETA